MPDTREPPGRAVYLGFDATVAGWAQNERVFSQKFCSGGGVAGPVALTADAIDDGQQGHCSAC